MQDLPVDLLRLCTDFLSVHDALSLQTATQRGIHGTRHYLQRLRREPFRLQRELSNGRKLVARARWKTGSQFRVRLRVAPAGRRLLQFRRPTRVVPTWAVEMEARNAREACYKAMLDFSSLSCD